MSEFIQWFGGTIWTFIDAVITALTLGLVFYNRYASYRQSKPVAIVLKNEFSGETIELTTVTRKHLSRAEISGVLGQFKLDSLQRYNIEYLSNQKFYDALMKAQNDKSDRIVIFLNDEEILYFKGKS